MRRRPSPQTQQSTSPRRSERLRQPTPPTNRLASTRSQRYSSSRSPFPAATSSTVRFSSTYSGRVQNECVVHNRGRIWSSGLKYPFFMLLRSFPCNWTKSLLDQLLN
ncbi:hypothetical protein BT93_E1839 [Corymbia citriodora subsp. variegata]|nr:hypothetical protein BT93_E1839 [Corymbia citriodora subsp. variegata]